MISPQLPLPRQLVQCRELGKVKLIDKPKRPPPKKEGGPPGTATQSNNAAPLVEQIAEKSKIPDWAVVALSAEELREWLLRGDYKLAAGRGDNPTGGRNL